MCFNLSSVTLGRDRTSQPGYAVEIADGSMRTVFTTNKGCRTFLPGTWADPSCLEAPASTTLRGKRSSASLPLPREKEDGQTWGRGLEDSVACSEPVRSSSGKSCSLGFLLYETGTRETCEVNLGKRKEST